jgi:MalT-like TPR region
LGELLYERGEFDEAESLLDDAYELGAEGGIVDFMLASFGAGARLKYARGEVESAHRRLAEGLGIARTLQLPRLEAGLLNESVRIAARSGEPIDESAAVRITSSMEETQIRLLLIDATPSALATACQRASARRERVDQAKHPRAHLHATLQLALCLGMAGNAEEAIRVLVPALKTCAALGLSQLIVDEGPQLLRLAQDAIVNSDVSDSVRDFVMNLTETSSV